MHRSYSAPAFPLVRHSADRSKPSAALSGDSFVALTWPQQLPQETAIENGETYSHSYVSNQTDVSTVFLQKNALFAHLSAYSTASALESSGGQSGGFSSSSFSAPMRFSLLLMGYALPALVPIAIVVSLAAAFVFVRSTRLSSGTSQGFVH